MAIDDPLDAAQDRIAAEQRAEPALARYGKDLSEIVGALPAALVPTYLAGPLDIAKSFLKAFGWPLRKTEDGRRRYLVEVVVEELRWLRDHVDHIDEKHVRFMHEEFPDLVLDGLQRAERTRSRERVARMGKVLGASARNGPEVTADEVEEFLRISMDLDDTDVKVLGALVEGQRGLLSSAIGMVTPGQANKFWQYAGNVSDSSGLSNIAMSLSISDGALQSAFAKLQAYGLLVQIERDESKLRRGTILYTILPRAVTFFDAISFVGSALEQNRASIGPPLRVGSAANDMSNPLRFAAAHRQDVHLRRFVAFAPRHKRQPFPVRRPCRIALGSLTESEPPRSLAPVRRDQPKIGGLLSRIVIWFSHRDYNGPPIGADHRLAGALHHPNVFVSNGPFLREAGNGQKERDSGRFHLQNGPRVYSEVQSSRPFHRPHTRRSPEHAHIEFKAHRIAEFDYGEAGMSRVQQQIPFSAYCGGRNEQSGRLSIANPIIAKSAQRFVPRCLPTRWKNLRIDSANFDRIRNLAFDENEICWPEIRFQIYKGFEGSERERS